MKNLSLSHRLSILLGAISICWSGSIDLVNANPNLFKVDRNQTIKTPRNIKIVGNLIPDDPAGLSYPVYQTACSNIKVSLKRDNKTIASTQAAGSTISNGCTYELNTGTLQLIVTGKLRIVAVSAVSSDSYGVSGSADITQPSPSQVDLKVSKYFSGPK